MIFLELQWEAWVPLELRRGVQQTFCVASGKSCLLSCCEGEHGIALESLQGIGPHLTGRVETRGVSRVAAGSFGFILSSNENLREPLMFPQGRQASFQVARATQDSSGVAAG